MAANEFVSREEAQGLLKKLREKAENRECVDCGAKNPTWATIWHGAYICFQCAGAHRGLGTHISFVRSTTLDNWKRSELRCMEAGGNQRFRDWLASHGAASLPVAERYKSPVAEQYRELLRAEANPEPAAAPVTPPQATPPPAPAAAAVAEPVEPAATPEQIRERGAAQAAEDAAAPRATVMGAKKSAATAQAAAPRGRLGAKKVDTESFFDAFDAPEATPEQASVAAVVADSRKSKPAGQSSMYTYTDDAMFATQQQQQSQTQQQGRRATPSVSPAATASAATASQDSDQAQRRFATAKAISSDQFFSEERAQQEARDPEKEARLSRFSGARAISSADYFERDETGMGGGSSATDAAARFASGAGTDLGAIRDTLVEKGRQLAGAAQQWFNEMQQS